jgi:hypothetical protein
MYTPYRFLAKDLLRQNRPTSASSGQEWAGGKRVTVDTCIWPLALCGAGRELVRRLSGP